MFPEFLPIKICCAIAAGKAFEYRNAKPKTLDRLEAEHYYGVVDGGDLAGKTVKSGIGQFEDLGGQGLVGRNQARHVLG